MRFVGACIISILVLAASQCALNPTRSFDVTWYHHGHEEYVVTHFVNSRDHWTLGFAHVPDGRRLYPGDPLTCWVTGKQYAVDDLTTEGSIVKAN